MASAEVHTWPVAIVEATVYRWVRQDRVDRGELGGTSTSETAELRAARRRITELESELATVRRASELFAEGRVVRPKALFGVVEMLAREGHGAKRVCRLLRVAPSGFFRWRSTPPSDRAIRRAWLADLIREIHAGGSPRVTLRSAGPTYTASMPGTERISST